MNKDIVKTIIEDAQGRFPTRGVSERLDGSDDPTGLLPVIMRDAGRSEVMEFFISRLTGAYDVRFDTPVEAAAPRGPLPVDQYLGVN